MPRPRRLLLTLLALPALFLFLFFLNTRSTNIYDLFSTTAQPSKLPDEIFGLLHFVTSPEEAGRVVIAARDATLDGGRGAALENDRPAGAVAPDKPISMAWYALGSIAKAGEFRRGFESAGGGWEERLKVLRQEYPLVVFSKVRSSLRAL